MVSFILKFLISGIVAIAWNYLTNDMQMSVFFFLFTLAILCLRPIVFQDPKQREEYIQKLKDARAKQEFLAAERKAEKKKLKSDEDRAEKQKQDLKNLQSRMEDL